MVRLTSVIALLVALISQPTRGAGQGKYAEPDLKPADRQHWSFVPPKRPPIPPTNPQSANPIDAFIRQKLDAAGLKPSPEADKVTLIRRVSLDLTGLPPTPSEVDAFLSDTAADAYEKVVDRLLTSPHFGERWAQHWLDVVRFAETNGYEHDGERPNAWRYRDYVIESFNNDKPYDRFTTEQLAGDELAAGKEAKEAADLWIATGMHRCGQVHMVSGNGDQVALRQEKLTEMVNGVGSTFMGLTVGCSRCHDHKFDPFSAGDYYRLQAFFAGAEYTDIDISTASERESRKKEADAFEAQMAPIRKQIAALDAPYRQEITEARRAKLEPKYNEALDTPAAKRTAEQMKLAKDADTLLKIQPEVLLQALTHPDREKRAALRTKLHDLEARMPPPVPTTWAIKAGKQAPTTFVLKRGDPHRGMLAVDPGYPRVLTTDPPPPKSRVELAKWMTDPEHPLTARVIVNRLWLHHFGRGLVNTPNDFGLRGEMPSHPELLDWLACELTDNKWSLKHIHRLIVTSSTYRQASSTSHGAKMDPENKLLWHMSRRRLEAEAVRDSVLTASGSLNRQVGGRSVKVPLEPEVYDLIFTEGEPDGLWLVTPDVKQHTRRSIYLFNKRNVRVPMLESLDQPDTLNSCAMRPVSTFAPQALILMNGPFVQEQGKALAIDLAKKCGPDCGKQIEALYRRALSRPPRDEEKRLAVEFVDAQADTIRDRVRARQPIGLDPTTLPEGADLARVRAMADLCVVMFNTHEFVYIP